MTRAAAKILLVEDHADIRHLIRLTLEFEPFEILEAATADEGWTLAQAQHPDLILLDVMMPGRLNGLDLCKLIKADPLLCNTPVLMLSACGHAADREAGFKAGAAAYLVKPFSPMALLKEVTTLLVQGVQS